MDIDEVVVPKGLGDAAQHVKQAMRGDAVAHMAKVRPIYPGPYLAPYLGPYLSLPPI